MEICKPKNLKMQIIFSSTTITTFALVLVALMLPADAQRLSTIRSRILEHLHIPHSMSMIFPLQSQISSKKLPIQQSTAIKSQQQQQRGHRVMLPIDSGMPIVIELPPHVFSLSTESKLGNSYMRELPTELREQIPFILQAVEQQVLKQNKNGPKSTANFKMITLRPNQKSVPGKPSPQLQSTATSRFNGKTHIEKSKPFYQTMSKYTQQPIVQRPNNQFNGKVHFSSPHPQMYRFNAEDAIKGRKPVSQLVPKPPNFGALKSKVSDMFKNPLKTIPQQEKKSSNGISYQKPSSAYSLSFNSIQTRKNTKTAPRQPPATERPPTISPPKVSIYFEPPGASTLRPFVSTPKKVEVKKTLPPSPANKGREQTQQQNNQPNDDNDEEGFYGVFDPPAYGKPFDSKPDQFDKEVTQRPTNGPQAQAIVQQAPVDNQDHSSRSKSINYQNVQSYKFDNTFTQQSDNNQQSQYQNQLSQSKKETLFRDQEQYREGDRFVTDRPYQEQRHQQQQPNYGQQNQQQRDIQQQPFQQQQQRPSQEQQQNFQQLFQQQQYQQQQFPQQQQQQQYQQQQQQPLPQQQQQYPQQNQQQNYGQQQTFPQQQPLVQQQQETNFPPQNQQQHAQFPISLQRPEQQYQQQKQQPEQRKQQSFIEVPQQRDQQFINNDQRINGHQNNNNAINNFNNLKLDYEKFPPPFPGDQRPSVSKDDYSLGPDGQTLAPLDFEFNDTPVDTASDGFDDGFDDYQTEVSTSAPQEHLATTISYRLKPTSPSITSQQPAIKSIRGPRPALSGSRSALRQPNYGSRLALSATTTTGPENSYSTADDNSDDFVEETPRQQQQQLGQEDDKINYEDGKSRDNQFDGPSDDKFYDEEQEQDTRDANQDQGYDNDQPAQNNGGGDNNASYKSKSQSFDDSNEEQTYNGFQESSKVSRASKKPLPAPDAFQKFLYQPIKVKTDRSTLRSYIGESAKTR